MTALYTLRAASKTHQQIKKVSRSFFVLPFSWHIKLNLPCSLSVLVIIITCDNGIQQSSPCFKRAKATYNSVLLE